MGLWDRFAGKSDLDQEPSGPSHAENLRAAVAIGTAQMRCHQDTWAYFVEGFEMSATGTHTSSGLLPRRRSPARPAA